MKKNLLLIALFSLALIFTACSSPEEDDVTAPGAPLNLTFNANLSGDGQVYLTWTAPADKDVDFYRIYRDSGTQTFAEITTVVDLFYLDLSLDYSIEYSYQVTAVDDSGNESAVSNTISVTPLNLFPPSTPTGIAIKAHNIVADGDLNVELTWNANTENDFSYYKIFRSATSPLFAAVDSTLLATVTGIFYLDEDVVPGNTFHYKLVAYDLGDVASNPTIVVSDTPLEVPSLTRPASEALQISLTPTFEWTNVNAAVKYKIVLRTSSLSDDIWESELPATTANAMSIVYPGTAPVALLGNTKYYWFVAGYSQDSDEINVYSATQWFRTM